MKAPLKTVREQDDRKLWRIQDLLCGRSQLSSINAQGHIYKVNIQVDILYIYTYYYVIILYYRGRESDSNKNA